MGKSWSLVRDHSELKLAWESEKEYEALMDLVQLPGYGDLNNWLKEDAAVRSGGKKAKSSI